jgi:phage gpG-like protein
MKALTANIVGGDKLVAKLRNAQTSVPLAVLREMKNQMARAADWSRANRLSGDPLNRRSGRLSRSINGDATLDGEVVRGTLSSNVPYAHVHEDGGTFNIPAYTRRPPRTRTAGGRLRKRTEAQNVASVTVQSHTATYPQRAFLRPSLDANRSRIVNALYLAAVQAFK